MTDGSQGGKSTEGGDRRGAPLPDRRLRGYAEIGVASLILGTSATLIQISTMPASLLVVLRMALAGIVLGALFLKTGGIDEVRRSGYFRRMVLVGFVVALELIFYFASIRLANVTVGVSLEYMAPVFVALLAPWVLRTRRQAHRHGGRGRRRRRHGAARAARADAGRGRAPASPGSSAAFSPA